jgi:hypothetical protein
MRSQYKIHTRSPRYKAKSKPQWVTHAINSPSKKASYDPQILAQVNLIQFLKTLAFMELVRLQNQDMCNQNNISLGGYIGYYRLVLTNQFVLNPVSYGRFQTAEYNEEQNETPTQNPQFMNLIRPSALRPELNPEISAEYTAPRLVPPGAA